MISLDVTIVFAVVWCGFCMSCGFSSCFFLGVPWSFLKTEFGVQVGVNFRA